MAEQREDVTPEECKQRYDEYKADYMQRLTLSFFDVHRTEVRSRRCPIDRSRESAVCVQYGHDPRALWPVTFMLPLCVPAVC